MNKRTIFLLPLLFLMSSTMLADEADRHHGATQNRADIKVFEWGDNKTGDCHQINAVLKIWPDGRATFDSDIWTHTHGTDVWHSTITLGPGDLGHGHGDSPGMPHNHDGPGNKVHLHFDFNFPAGNFGTISEAVEHSAC
jgi:hypothetical protein